MGIFALVSRGQTAIFYRAFVACSISDKRPVKNSGLASGLATRDYMYLLHSPHADNIATIGGVSTPGPVPG